jgi:heme exporter protein B
MAKLIALIFYTEVRLLLRQAKEWLYPLVFFVIVVCLFPISLSPKMEILQRFIPGCIWLAALFASLLSIQQVFSHDLEDHYLEQLLLSDGPLPLLILTKLSAHWLVTQLPLILLTPFLGIIFQLNASTILLLVLTLLLGTPIIFLVGALTIALTIGLRQQGSLLGLIILPLITPVLIFAICILDQQRAGFIIFYHLIFFSGLLLLALTLLPIAIAATLRISMDT